MKNVFSIGADAPAAKLDTTVAFLLDRRQATGVAPAGRRAGSAYVWRRVFLKGKERRA